MRRKEERSKQGQTNNKAKQHSAPKAVTFPRIMSCLRWDMYLLLFNLSSFLGPQVMRVCDKELLSDKLKWVKFSSIAWTHDNKGFFYQVKTSL